MSASLWEKLISLALLYGPVDCCIFDIHSNTWKIRCFVSMVGHLDLPIHQLKRQWMVKNCIYVVWNYSIRLFSSLLTKSSIFYVLIERQGLWQWFVKEFRSKHWSNVQHIWLWCDITKMRLNNPNLMRDHGEGIKFSFGFWKHNKGCLWITVQLRISQNTSWNCCVITF